jgi:hypothetical protein
MLLRFITNFFKKFREQNNDFMAFGNSEEATIVFFFNLLKF